MVILVRHLQESIRLQQSSGFALIPSKSKQEFKTEQMFLLRVHAEYLGLSHPLILMKLLGIKVFKRHYKILMNKITACVLGWVGLLFLV